MATHSINSGPNLLTIYSNVELMRGGGLPIKQRLHIDDIQKMSSVKYALDIGRSLIRHESDNQKTNLKNFRGGGGRRGPHQIKGQSP